MRPRAFPVSSDRVALGLFVLGVVAGVAAAERAIAAGGTTETSAGFVTLYERDHVLLIVAQAVAALTFATLTIRAIAVGRASAWAVRGGLAATALYGAVWLVPGLMALSPDL